MATRESNLVVRLIDGVSGPAHRAAKSLHNMRGAATDRRLLGGLNAIGATVGRMDTALAGYAMRVGGPLLAGYGIAEAGRVANSTETALVRLGITAGVSAEQMQRAKSQIQAIAPELGVAQGELYRVLETLVAGGLSWGQALEALPQVVKTAKASGTAMEEVAAASIAVMQNLQVPAAEIQKAFDSMVAGGKAGAFELRDMAREFPSIAASAAKVGMTGTEAVADLAAMAQIARKTAGSSSEAANNMVNFLEKLTADTTVKNFKKFGVDITKVFKKAQKDGVSFTDAILDIIDKITAGDPFKVAELFPDMQARNFLNSVLANQDELRRLRGEIRNSAGAVERDFGRVSETTREALNRAGAAVENVADRLGTALQPAATASADAVVRLSGKFTSFMDDIERRYTVFDRLADKMREMGSGEPIQIFGEAGRQIDDFLRQIDRFEQEVLGLRPPGEVIDELLFGKPVTVDRSTEIAAAALDRAEKLKGEIAGVRDKVAAAEIAAVEAETKEARATAKAEADGLRAEIARLERAIADAQALAGRMGARDMTGVEAGQERATAKVEGDRWSSTTPAEDRASRDARVAEIEVQLSRLMRAQAIADLETKTAGAGLVHGTDVDGLAKQISVLKAELDGLTRSARDVAVNTATRAVEAARPAPAERSEFAMPRPKGQSTGGDASGFAIPTPKPNVQALLAPYDAIPARLEQIGSAAGTGLTNGVTTGATGATAAASGLRERIGGALDGLGARLYASGESAVAQLAAGIRAGIPQVSAAASEAAGAVAAKFPASPAKEGPLRHLPSMGRKIVSQLVDGMDSTPASRAAERVAGAFAFNAAPMAGPAVALPSALASIARPAATAEAPSRSVSIGDVFVTVNASATDRPADMGRQIGEAIRRRLDGEFADVFA